MADIAEYMKALAERTGWSGLSAPDNAGVRRVALEDDLDAAFFALGDRWCIMHGVVTELPASAAESEALCATAAAKVVAAIRERPSILALEEPGPSPVPGEIDLTSARLVCFRSVPMNTDTTTLVSEVQAWLNDFAWWKNVLGETQAQGMGSGFSEGMFPGLRI
ncbi:MAG: hypothetical protein IJU37_04005 [Desulfovibrio sp.]|nr:hypothetical protein [Desulfovibrio sp.]